MPVIINGTTGVSGVDGSASTPAFQGTDTNTGISFGTDTVTINTGGVARVTTDASGNVGIGTSYSVTPASGVTVQTGNNASVNVGHTNSSTGFLYANFAYNGGQIGSITQNGTTGVSFNTTSDYRLKENVQPMTGALAKVAQLNPVTYTWKSDGSDGQGFIAHELQAVVPDCVTGEKDAVDEDGNPIYQGVDTSFLVATLTAAIQELKAELDSVKSELATLKAGA